MWVRACTSARLVHKSVLKHNESRFQQVGSQLLHRSRSGQQRDGAAGPGTCHRPCSTRMQSAPRVLGICGRTNRNFQPSRSVTCCASVISCQCVGMTLIVHDFTSGLCHELHASACKIGKKDNTLILVSLPLRACIASMPLANQRHRCSFRQRLHISGVAVRPTRHSRPYT